MPQHRFFIDRADKVYSALVVAADTARESPYDFELGPWEDSELRESQTIEITGSDEAVALVVERWISEGVGFDEL